MLDIERMRREHHEEPWLIGKRCNRCQNAWPCDTARLLTVLTPDVVALAELMALEKAGSVVWSYYSDEWAAFVVRKVGSLSLEGYATPTELLAAVRAL